MVRRAMISWNLGGGTPAEAESVVARLLRPRPEIGQARKQLPESVGDSW